MFDIRAQLMAEDSAGYDNEALIAGLEEGDLKPHFYEGGFKTWECALDLAKLVTAQEMMSVADDVSMDLHIIEVRTLASGYFYFQFILRCLLHILLLTRDLCSSIAGRWYGCPITRPVCTSPRPAISRVSAE